MEAVPDRLDIKCGWVIFWKAGRVGVLDLQVVVSQIEKVSQHVTFKNLRSDSQRCIPGLASIRTALVTCWCTEAGTFLDLGFGSCCQERVGFPLRIWGPSGHHLGTKVKSLRKHCKRQDLAVYWPRIRSVYP